MANWFCAAGNLVILRSQFDRVTRSSLLIRRTSTVAALAGAIVMATPGLAHAVVPSTPTGGSPGFDGDVVAVSHRGFRVYVAGEFDHVTDADGSATYRRNGVAAFDNRTGEVLPWNPRVEGRVEDLVAASDGVYLVGQFASVRGARRDSFARVGSRTAKLLGGRHSFDGAVNAISLSRYTVYVGGDFTRADGKARKRLAAFRRGGSFAIRGWDPAAAGGPVQDVVRTRVGIYVAGLFTALNGRQADNGLALVDGRTGATRRRFAPGVGPFVLDIFVGKGRVAVALGGPRGGAVMSVARSDGDTAWVRRLDGDAEAVTLMRGQAYVGGHFDAVCDNAQQDPAGGDCQAGQTARRHGASLRASDGSVTDWNPHVNSAYGILEFDTYGADERLWVAGAFTKVREGAIEEPHLAVYDTP